jgi:hypothetical protein
MTKHTQEHPVAFDQYLLEKQNHAASAIRVQGILAIVFGGLGILGSIILGFIFLASLATFPERESVEISVYLVLGFVFFFLPHIYLLVSGLYLLKKPAPKIVFVLSIINLVVGFFWNVFLLVVAIISLVVHGDYERGYLVQGNVEKN